MLRKLRPHLTYANVVSTLCLFILLGGSAYAAVTINGNQLKDRSVAGKKLKSHTLTGNQINFSRLGKVPSASLADRAMLANHATLADNASLLAGKPAANFLPAGKLKTTGGLLTVSVGPSPNGHSATVLTVGPVTLTQQCIDEGSPILTYNLIASTTKSAVIIYNGTQQALEPGAPVTLLTSTRANADYFVLGVPWAAATADGFATSGIINSAVLVDHCGTGAFAAS